MHDVRRTLVLALALALSLGLVACAHAPAGPAVGVACPALDAPEASDARLGAAQARLNRYFIDTVATPAWKDCWNQLHGEGLVAMDFTYGKSGPRWGFENVAVTRSSLGGGQDAVAVRCMQQALRGSGFAVEPADSNEQGAKTFVVRWTWPVPMPMPGKDPQLLARMIGSTGLDEPGCSACVSRKEYPYGLKCESRTSGGALDCREHQANVCSVSPTACLKGSFGIAGGVVMY